MQSQAETEAARPDSPLHTQCSRAELGAGLLCRQQVEAELRELGATVVTTPEELRGALAASGLVAPRLALDCVAGDTALAIAKTLE